MTDDIVISPFGIPIDTQLRLIKRALRRLPAETPAPRLTIAQHAVAHLRETGNPCVQWCDARLLHAIAARAGLEPRGPVTERQVLNALDRSKLFTKSYCNLGPAGQHRDVRVFTPRSHPEGAA